MSNKLIDMIDTTGTKNVLMENQTQKASIEDLRKSALDHYEELAIKANHWKSDVADAINFYYDSKKIEGNTIKQYPLTEDECFEKVSFSGTAQKGEDGVTRVWTDGLMLSCDGQRNSLMELKNGSNYYIEISKQIK